MTEDEIRVIGKRLRPSFLLTMFGVPCCPAAIMAAGGGGPVGGVAEVWFPYIAMWMAPVGLVGCATALVAAQVSGNDNWLVLNKWIA